jgi:hypothetical protein
VGGVEEVLAEADMSYELRIMNIPSLQRSRQLSKHRTRPHNAILFGYQSPDPSISNSQTPRPIPVQCLMFFLYTQNIPIRAPQPLSFGLITIWYGNGFASLVVIGGMWSFSLFTVVTIFIAAFSNIASIAFRTLALSITKYQYGP